MEIVRHLGDGGYASVDLVRHPEFGLVAYKKPTTRTGDETYVNQFKKEIQIQKQLKHQNIVKLFDADTDVGIYMEYMKHGSVDSFIENFEVSLEWKSQILLDVSNGMAYLHGQDIIHGDLKCQNILIDNTFHAKISDFGLARNKQNPTIPLSRDQLKGTLVYIAPEYLSNPSMKKSEKFDVYGFAISSWEIVSGKRAYNDYSVRTPDFIQIQVEKGERPTMEDFENNIPDYIRTIISNCWHQTADNRPTFPQLCEVLTENLKPIHDKLQQSRQSLTEQEADKRQQETTSVSTGVVHVQVYNGVGSTGNGEPYPFHQIKHQSLP